MQRPISASLARFGRLLLPLLLVSISPAQIRGTFSSGAAHSGTPHSQISHSNLRTGSFAFARGAYPSGFRRSYPYTSLPFPFFVDSFNPDDIYSTGYPVASQPPVIFFQAARATAGSADYSRRPDYDQEFPASQPLMIELQNGHYVHVNRSAADGEALPLTTPEPAIAAASPAHDLPPALLVFRDGHSEEVRDYTIADGILYARGDYYTDGYWNKKIELSTLNLAQTLAANTTRNIKFVLPNSPNEVITRP